MKGLSIIAKYFTVALCLTIGMGYGVKEGHAQGADALQEQSSIYLKARIDALEKTNNKTTKLYRRFLNRMGLSSDSVAVFLDSVPNAGGVQPVHSRQLDSLRSIYAFVASQSGDKLTDHPYLSTLSSRIRTLEQQQGLRHKLEQLIAQSVDGLSVQGYTDKAAILKKELAILQARASYYKRIYEEPEEAELMALEYLQGTRGFGSSFGREQRSDVLSTAHMNGKSIAELESMGFQTKRSVKADMEAAGGGAAFEDVEKTMAAAYNAYMEQQGSAGSSLLGKGTAVTQKIKAYGSDVENIKNQAMGLGSNIKKPLFTNPMRGVPFRYRFETQYNLQTIRPGVDNRPGMINFSYSALYRQTDRLSYGMGVSGSVGFGTGWRDIRLSYEGAGVQLILDYRLMRTLSIQGVWEEQWGGSSHKGSLAKNEDISSLFSRSGRRSAYVGLLQRTDIGKKWQSTFFIGYDILWKNNNNHSPFVCKVGFGKTNKQQ